MHKCTCIDNMKINDMKSPMMMVQYGRSIFVTSKYNRPPVRFWVNFNQITAYMGMGALRHKCERVLPDVHLQGAIITMTSINK